MNSSEESRWETIKRFWSQEYIGLWFIPGFVSGIVIGVVSISLLISGEKHPLLVIIDEIQEEIVGIVITVGILERWQKQRIKRQDEELLKRELSLKVLLPVQAIVIPALADIRQHKWEYLLRQASSFRELHWSETNLNDVDLSELVFEKCDFQKAKLENTLWLKSKITYSYFTDAELCGADFTEANLENSSFKGANLENAVLDKAIVFKVDFEGANLENCHMVNATTKYGILSVIEDGYVEKFGITASYNVNLSQACLDTSTLNSSVLEKATLERASLLGAHLYKTSLKNAYMVGAELAFANLRETDLRGANLTDSLLAGVYNIDTARFDNTTIMPDGSNWSNTVDIEKFTNPAHRDFQLPKQITEYRHHMIGRFYKELYEDGYFLRFSDDY